MRHIRNRKRFKLVLVVLFTLCLTMFLESRIEALVPELKSLAETHIEQMMGGRMRLFIGSVDGGILQPIALNDIRIQQAKGSVLFQSLVISNIRTNYHVWDLLKSAKDKPEALEKGSSIYATFTAPGGDVRGFVGLEGDLTDSKVSGYLVFYRKHKICFSGTVKGDVFDMEIRPDRPDLGSLRATGGISDDGVFAVHLRADHLKLGGFDVVFDADLRNRKVSASEDRDGYIEGSLETKKLILNYKPFADLKASYRVSRGVLEITAMSLGEILKAHGKVNFKKPAAVDLTLLANNVSLSWLMLTFGQKEATSILTGTMSGKFEMKGPVKKMRLNSRFEIRKGTIGPLDFDGLSASVRGELPFLKIEDSRITRQSGYFALAGEIDMRRAGKDNMFDNIRLVTDDGAISWDDWKTTSSRDGQNVSMRKRLYDNIEIEYKKVVDGNTIDESSRDKDEVRFEYKLQPTDSLKVMVGQDNDFFGFEHKDKF